MSDGFIQCGNCGHETPAESVYCEHCGCYLLGGFPTPPSFLDMLSRSDDRLESNYEGGFKNELEGIYEPESEIAVEPKLEDAFLSEQMLQVQSGAFEDDAESDYNSAAYREYAAYHSQRPSIPAIKLNDGDYSFVDPEPAPYQPKIGPFRIAVVGLMAVLFGIAIVLLFCLVVMNLLGL